VQACAVIFTTAQAGYRIIRCNIVRPSRSPSDRVTRAFIQSERADICTSALAGRMLYAIDSIPADILDIAGHFMGCAFCLV
jgi:hypothetical protein